MSDNKKVVNRVNIDPFGYAWALKMANRHGVSLGDLVGQAVSSLAVAWNVETDEITETKEFDSRYLRLSIDHFEEQQRHRRRQLVREVAIIHTQYPDDASAERLERMCEAAGMDLTEILSIANSTEFGSVVEYSRDGSKFGKCVMWLADYITRESKDGNGVPTGQIFAAGKSNGFEEQMIQRAKRRIRSDPLSPSIESTRIARGWVWHIRIPESKE